MSRSSHGMSPLKLCSLLRVRLLGCSGPQAKPDRPQVGLQGLGWTIFILFHYLGFLNRFLFRNNCKYIEKLQKYYKELVFPETLESKLLAWYQITLKYFTVYFFKYYILPHNHKMQPQSSRNYQWHITAVSSTDSNQSSPLCPNNILYSKKISSRFCVAF